MNDPQAPTVNGNIVTEVYEVNLGWYLEIVIPHPDNPEMPDQLMTIKCDNEWWAKFLQSAIQYFTDNTPNGVNSFLADAPEFRYEG